METAIQITGLVKYFDGRCILNGIDLTVQKGCVYGLLGRNGVGKTTLIRILLGLEPATRGDTFLFDEHSYRLTRKTKARIGYVAEGHHLIQAYSVRRLTQLCKSLAPKWNKKLFAEMSDLFDLPMDRKIKQLSNGMRAQLNLSLAMAVEPELLILDDPTLGLDTVIRRQFLKLAIDVIQRDGRTILFSSHILSDVERIADRIGILYGGKLVADCSLEKLKKSVKKFRVIFNEKPPKNLHLSEIIHHRQEGREMLLTIVNFNQQKKQVIESFAPESIVEVPMSLEDIFIECTDKLQMPVEIS